MLSGNRKRHRSCDSGEEQQLTPQAKRSGGGPSLLVSDLDSESSSNDSSNGVSSPEGAPEAGAERHGLHGPSASYDHINRVLREAHFSSLQSRGSPGST